jgi:hypothetical protein
VGHRWGRTKGKIGFHGGNVAVHRAAGVVCATRLGSTDGTAGAGGTAARLGFYSKLEIPACIQGLTDFKLALGFPKYTTGFQSHTLWFSLFLVVARLSSRRPPPLNVSSCCSTDRWRGSR